VKASPSKHLTEQIPLKDTTIYDKLEVDNWEEWEQNTPNLLDTIHLHEYTEGNYGLAIEHAQQYCHLCQQEVLNFTAPSLPLSASSGKDLSQATLLPVLLFAPYPWPLSGPQTRTKKNPGHVTKYCL